MSPQGYPALTTRPGDITTDDLEPNFIKYVLMLGPSSSIMANTDHWIPLNTLFGLDRLRDVKRASAGRTLKLQDSNVNTDEEYHQEVAAIESLYLNGLDVKPGPHPLDSVVAFRQYNANEARQARFVPWECQPSADKQQPENSTTYPYFPLPAFGLTGKVFHASV